MNEIKQPVEWSPWSGCSPTSPGCLNCYAMKPESGGGLTMDTKRGPVWTGELRLNEGAFDLSAYAHPTSFIVCPHGDMFHENAPDEWIERAIATIDANRQHLFMVLTKRSKRMLAFVNARYGAGKQRGYAPMNLVLGVSAERQIEADDRLPDLFAARVLRRYVTLFPLLGPIDLAAVPGAAEGFTRIREIHVGEDRHRPAAASWFEQIEQDCQRLGLSYRRADLDVLIADRGF